MKKTRLLAAIFALAASFSLAAKDITLEQTLGDAAAKISGAIDGKMKTVAVLDIRSDYWALSDYIVAMLNDELVNTLEQTNVAERDEYSLSLIQQESDYQLSGAVSDETIQEIGAALGADCIVLGNMETVSGGWQLILRVSTVETKKVLSSWRGKVSSKEKEVKFQVEKSKKSPRPVTEVKKKTPVASASDKVEELAAMVIDQDGKSVSVLHPGDVVRFRVSSEKSAYLAILCIDANGEENWLPMNDNYIRAGESRIFPDLQGVQMRVDEGTYGKEQVIVYAAPSERDLPNQRNMMGVKGTRGFSLVSGNGGSETKTRTINYTVERR